MKNNNNDVLIQIWVSKELKKEMKKWCAENSTSLSAESRRIWRQKLSVKE